MLHVLKVGSRNALLFCGFVLLVTAQLCAGTKDARISFVQGTVEIGDAKGSMKPAVLGYPLRSSSSVRTGSDGLAEIDFTDGSMLRLTGDTALFPRGTGRV